MCFSAGASFGAGAILSLTGYFCLKNATPARKPLAAIPLAFAVQQVSEGFVWLGLKDQNEQFIPFFMYVFLFFAQVFWPFWVPFSLWKMEVIPHRKKMLGWITIIGAGVSSFYLFAHIVFGATAQIENNHITYFNNVGVTAVNSAAMFYFIATVTGFFISSEKKNYLLGLLVLASLAVSMYFFNGQVISIWCYFAALISIVILYIVARPGNKSA
jgi:drug/metabolite transporter (DMT)-like permease